MSNRHYIIVMSAIIWVAFILGFLAGQAIKPINAKREPAEQVLTVHDVMPALIQVESSGNENAVSACGAYGLCQITQVAAEQVNYSWDGVKSNPDYNIQCGEAYLLWCWERFPALSGEQRLTHALYAYNWGIGNVRAFQKGQKALPSCVQSYAHRIITLAKGE